MRAALLRSPGSPTSDGGGIVISWLAKIALVFAVAGFVLFDAISVASTTANVADQGSTAAMEASSVWDETHDVQAAYAAAVASATEQDPGNSVSAKGFAIDPDGTVHLRVSREARTLILFRWDKTRKWAVVSRTARGRSVSS
jgi:Flp pilus assembly protein TadG